MLSKIFQLFTLFSLSIFLFTSCATVFKGYEDSVELINAPDEMRIYSIEGIEIPISHTITKGYSNQSKKIEVKETKSIKLRSNKEHILLLKTNDKEKLVEIYPRIEAGWLILDFITGIFPVFIDIYTGNWNGFKPITISF